MSAKWRGWEDAGGGWISLVPVDPFGCMFITPGENEPSGFILTTILGIVGAFLATYLGQAIGWYRADEGAGLIGAVVGAVIILLIWGFIAGRRRPSS